MHEGYALTTTYLNSCLNQPMAQSVYMQKQSLFSITYSTDRSKLKQKSNNWSSNSIKHQEQTFCTM